MAQTYTLEEAADKLNLSIEEFKRRLRTEWTQIRSFRDGATLRFRANEIDELARTYGLGSSDEMPLAESSPLDVPDDIGLAPKPKAKKGDSGAPLNLDDSSEEAFVLTPDAPAAPKSKKGDSDVRLEAADKKKADDDEESILTEELELPSAGGSAKLSGKSGKLSSAKLKSGDSGKQKKGDSGKQKGDSSGKHKKPAPPPADDSSEFELTLDADSDEFELSLTQDSSDEVSLGEMPASTPASKSGRSGINLNRPADSGVSLENKKKGDDDEIDFELSLDAPGSGMSSRKNLAGTGSGKASGSGKGKGPASGSGKKKKQPDSDSEFELSLEEPSDSGLDLTPAADKKGDIFEATDFEIPALDDDSASEAVSLDDSDTDVESSDFDLALDDADADADDADASQVVALDDDDAPKSRKKKKRRTDDDDDDVDLDDAAGALRGVRDDDEDEVAAGEMVAAPAQWGPWPAVMMFPTLIVLFLGAIMAFEVLHSMWGYQQSNQPGTPLVNFVAEKFDMKPAQ